MTWQVDTNKIKISSNCWQLIYFWFMPVSRYSAWGTSVSKILKIKNCYSYLEIQLAIQCRRWYGSVVLNSSRLIPRLGNSLKRVSANFFESHLIPFNQRFSKCSLVFRNKDGKGRCMLHCFTAKVINFAFHILADVVWRSLESEVSSFQHG